MIFKSQIYSRCLLDFFDLICRRYFKQCLRMKKDDASIHSIIYWHLEITEFLILAQENLNQNDPEITSKIENHEKYHKEKHDILRFLG